MTLAGMVGALSLKRQQHPIAALQAQALDLSQHAQQAPVHSHFRPCWGQRGAAIGLPMLPHVGQVAVEVRTEKLSRSVAAAFCGSDVSPLSYCTESRAHTKP